MSFHLDFVGTAEVALIPMIRTANKTRPRIIPYNPYNKRRDILKRKEVEFTGSGNRVEVELIWGYNKEFGRAMHSKTQGILCTGLSQRVIKIIGDKNIVANLNKRFK